MDITVHAFRHSLLHDIHDIQGGSGFFEESFRWRTRIHMLFRDTVMRLSGDFTAVLGGLCILLKSTVDPKERTMCGFTSSTLTFRRYSGGVKRQLLSCHKIFDLHNVRLFRNQENRQLLVAWSDWMFLNSCFWQEFFWIPCADLPLYIKAVVSGLRLLLTLIIMDCISVNNKHIYC